MATNAAIASQLFHFSPSHPSFTSRHLKLNRQLHSTPRISCRLDQTSEDDDTKRKRNVLELMKLSATVTIISTSLPPQAALAAKVSSSKKRASASSKKKQQQEELTPEQYNSWAGDLPVVKDRLACTDIFDLKQEGKLKHVIKPPLSDLGRRAEVVLAVLGDNRVLRTVVPSLEGNPNFWKRWNELGIDSICVNAYTPPLKKPEIPSPYLGFLSGIPRWMISMLKAKAERDKVVQEQKKAKEEKRMKKRKEIERIRLERAMMDWTYEAEKKMEDERIKKEKKEKRREMIKYGLTEFYSSVGDLWRSSSTEQNQTVEIAIACLFFVVFYRVVVLSYKKQKKDYDDRVKIEEADAEEKRKIKELEMEMSGRDADDRIDGEGEGGGEDNPNMKMARQFMRSGARIRRTGGAKRKPQFLEKDVDVKFADVAGLGKIRVELEEIVKFFKEADVYRKRGVKIPGGILLCGPPGVGKTLLAKAVAGEAGVNFLSISASQFVEIYVGVGASRVRALYQEAKELAPAVVFIDELDAVGRERGRLSGSGGQERDATLNQLLVSLDGFEGRGDVITIASTNRPDVLDPALVRPGRFDRKIFITKPSSAGRLEILQVHARKKPLAEDVDLEAVARATEGMVGADLANIFEVAALNMLREGRKEMTTDDLLQAAVVEHSGKLLKHEHSDERWRQMAINQAAEAVVSINFPDYKNVEFITIAPRAGSDLGYVRWKMDYQKSERQMFNRQDVLDHITIQLAPRAADEMYHGKDQLSTIWAESADDARASARTFVLSCLSEKRHGVFFYWTDKLNDIDTEALRILNMCYDRVKEILRRNRKLLDAVVDKLTEKKELTKQEFLHLVDLYGDLDPPHPTTIELRAQHRERIRQKMITDRSTTTAPNVSGGV